jgi:hypothetical protein
VSSLLERLQGRLPKSLTHVVPVSHHEDRAVVRRRRRIVAVVTVVGAGSLGASLSTRPGSRAFYTSTSVVAGIWTLGGLVSGPLHRGWVQSRDDQLRRPVLTPVATGAGAFAVFYTGGQVARRIQPLRRAISDVLAFAEEGDNRRVLLVTLANGVGEEIFFRGALYTALGERHPVAISTLVYTLATTTTRNPALVLAAAVMGSLFGLQRRASRGVQAPLLTHLTWSSLMVRYLPPMFRQVPRG